jgi:peptide/nickel transport system substrate-binding protein
VAIQASLARCGITLDGRAEPASSFFTDAGNAPANNRAGIFDLVQAGWIPDWFGANGRTIIPPLVQTDCQVNTINYGCYSSPGDGRADHVGRVGADRRAGGAVLAAGRPAMKSALIVPLQSENYPVLTSERVHGPGIFSPTLGAPDPTNLWLSAS